MSFIHKNLDHVNKGSLIKVSLSNQANVLLLDNSNYQKYRRGEKHRYYGGWFKTTPACITIPASGHWHLVLNLGGRRGTIRYSISVVA